MELILHCLRTGLRTGEILSYAMKDGDLFNPYPNLKGNCTRSLVHVSSLPSGNRVGPSPAILQTIVELFDYEVQYIH